MGLDGKLVLVGAGIDRVLVTSAIVSPAKATVLAELSRKAQIDVVVDSVAGFEALAGALADDDAGILAGQWLPYLTYSMQDFKSGAREMPKKMRKKVEALDDFDIDALMHYFASQR